MRAKRKLKKRENILKDSATSNVLLYPIVSIGNAAKKIIFDFSKIPVDKINFGAYKGRQSVATLYKARSAGFTVA